jgi:SAM-dependent methyltransferase
LAGLRERTPWWVKLPSKLLLSRLPISYRSWRTLGIFRHGAMLSPDYARAVFHKHFELARGYLPPSFRVLELGPGDSLATAILAAAEGAGEIILVDAGDFAERDVDAYRPLLSTLRVRLFLEPRDLEDLESLLRACRTRYLTGGLRDLRALESDSIHFTFSNAVLEHTPLMEFEETLHELYRVQAPGGVGSHQIDLRDHLGNSLHSLRFSRKVWESGAFRSSGFYTNRMRASEILDAFTRVGYEVVCADQAKWASLPLRRHVLHESFRGFDEEDLRTYGLTLVVRKAP